ncbi:hypothetical protein O181_004521 [Austropuccinia psidii MF-1]|uniref:Aldose 1-epimerase n=1 Tax=Austropuccinia psidii MF-1 TaxID=1389203 RepID=A0A9Q3BFQ1_9BASI|nr:hypothetical protein [Austropuccinia psidii MF-1]
MVLDRLRPLPRSARSPSAVDLETSKPLKDAFGSRIDNDTDEDSDDSQLVTFPPQANTLLLSSFSRLSHRTSTNASYRTCRMGPRGFKLKVTGRSFRTLSLILLSIFGILALFLFPWRKPRSDLDLRQLRTLENPLDPLALHNLSAPDGSIYASFLGVGATVQSLLVKDRWGAFRDIVLGFDNASEYLNNPINPRFGSIVGRYANRIKNCSFTMPGNPSQVYHTTPNDHEGLDTLHGGKPGWDLRPFKVEVKNLSYIAFSLIDGDGEQGFPSQVFSKVEYELLPGAKWKTKISATAGGKTPLMASSHVYWNLDAYMADEPASEHFLQLNAPLHILVDGFLIPTGKIESVAKTPLDFTQATRIGARLNQTEGLCGKGCKGYDNAFVYDTSRSLNAPAMHLWSEKSGIKMSVTTDQLGVQLYTCNNIHSDNSSIKPIPRKRSQTNLKAIYENHSCVVIEQQGFIDAINNPHWQIDSIYGPDRPYEWNSVYEFSVT